MIKRRDLLAGLGGSAIALSSASCAPMSSSLSPAADALASPAADAAWQRFAERLKAAGAIVPSAFFADNERDLAEGYRYFARLVAFALQHEFGFSDPAFPSFQRGLDDLAPWGAPNIDNVYMRAVIDGRHQYRVGGNISRLHGMILNVNEGQFPIFPGFKTSFETSHHELHIEPNGDFEIILGGPPSGRNWIPLEPRDRGFSIREYLYNWSDHQPATLYIERIGGEGQTPATLDMESLSSRMDKALHWAETVARYYLDRLAKELASATPNQLPPPSKRVPGSAYAHYGLSFFDLAPDDALFIEMPVNDAPYWCFQLYNLWNEFTDPFHRSTSVNGAQAHIDADGLFRVAVAHKDPGIANWLDTAGQRRGYLWYRWFWADAVPTPIARVVKTSSVQGRVPEAGHITPAMRREQLAGRRRQLQMRFHR